MISSGEARVGGRADRFGESRRASGVAGSAGAWLSRALDTISDLAVGCFAVWTVLYHVGLIFGVHTDPLLLVWVISVPGVLYLLVRTSGDSGESVAEHLHGARHRGRPRGIVPLAVVLALASAAMVFSAKEALWWPGWTCAGAAVALGLAGAVRASRSATAVPGDGPRLAETLAVLLSGAGLAAFSVFIVRPDPDDVFYLNKTAWTADHGTIASRDTIFTDQQVSAIRGPGVPASSIETFQGAVAHVFHLTGGTATYILTPPVAVFLTIWAIWRLIRHWAPRRQFLCFAVAVLYLMWDALNPEGLGEFFIDRIAHGKSIFVSMMVPLVFLYLSRWARTGGRREAALLLTAGIAAVGLTSSATFLMPLLCAGAAAALLLLRRPRLALGCLLACVYPVVVGLVVHFSYSSVDPNLASYTGEAALRYVFQPRWYGAVGWIATFAGFWLIRSVPARAVAIGASAALLVLAAPGVFAAMNDLTGAGAVVWRAMWLVPIPVLVGLLASVPLPREVRWLAPLPAAALIALILAAGVPPIAHQRLTSLADHPTWRFPIAWVKQAREVVAASHGNGPVLAPPAVSRAIAITTTRVHAVDPMGYYAVLTDESADRKQARLLLGGWIGGWQHPPTADVGAALAKLDVRTVCIQPEWIFARRTLLRFGYGDPQRAGAEVCYSRG